jgi:peptidyl-dipeptidase A
MKQMTTKIVLVTLVCYGFVIPSLGADAVPKKGTPCAATDQKKEAAGVKEEVKMFLKKYQQEYAKLDLKAQLAFWTAANSGKKEDFDASAAATLVVRKFHSDPDAYQKLVELTGHADELNRVQARALHVAELAYKGNQLPTDLLGRMVNLSTDIERTFNTFRGEIDGKAFTNNDLLEMLRKEADSAQRKKTWEALKQVGGAVAPKLIELARLRNEAAKKLGFDNFWDMKIRLQEHDPEQLLALFDELERLTREPFTRMKAKMDSELAGRFGVKPEELMPWHYDNPFFQAAPPSDAIDLNEFYEKKTREELVEISRVFFAEIGLPADDILRRSDLYDREGKDQHAFCISMDRKDDVRTLCNVKPTAEWMDTVLHELGHAVYDVAIDRRLPFNLREPSHAFTTEGVAMLLGALGKNPKWMVAYGGADEKRVEEVAEAILEQRRREQLIFARWTMVMLHFEKALYENPEQDLNKLWWDYVARYQQLTPPADRDEPDWAAKPHFTIAPVYYHNYMMGEVFAAQLRHALAELAGHQGPTSELSFNGRKDFGEYLKEKVFKPGNVLPWPQFVRRASGEKLTAKYFAVEVR